jgi:hypothetical protein
MGPDGGGAGKLDSF